MAPFLQLPTDVVTLNIRFQPGYCSVCRYGQQSPRPQVQLIYATRVHYSTVKYFPFRVHPNAEFELQKSRFYWSRMDNLRGNGVQWTWSDGGMRRVHGVALYQTTFLIELL